MRKEVLLEPVKRLDENDKLDLVQLLIEALKFVGTAHEIYTPVGNEAAARMLQVELRSPDLGSARSRTMARIAYTAATESSPWMPRLPMTLSYGSRSIARAPADDRPVILGQTDLIVESNAGGNHSENYFEV